MAKTEAAPIPSAETDDRIKAPVDDFKARATAYIREPIANALARVPDAGTASYSDLKGVLRTVQETVSRLLAGPEAIPETVAEAEPDA